MSRFARSGAVLTVINLKGPFLVAILETSVVIVSVDLLFAVTCGRLVYLSQ